MHLKRQEGGSQVGALGACWASLEGLEVDLKVVQSEIPWAMNEGLLLVDLCMVLAAKDKNRVWISNKTLLRLQRNYFVSTNLVYPRM